MKDIKISFIGIGGQKCASTWIYDILADQKEVALSRAKELDFFSNYWDRGYGWYENQFERDRLIAAKVIGEVSPSYLSDTDAPARAAQYNPDMRIILTLRNPIDRAYSNHKHNIRQGFVFGDDLSFEKSLAENPTYIEHGYYGKHLEKWLKYFPKEQILIIYFEDIVANPEGVAAGVYRFLGISEDFVTANFRKKSNESVAVANVRLALFVDGIRNYVKASNMISWVWGLLNMLGVRAIYRLLNMREVNSKIPKMLPETRDYLASLYRSDIDLLESIVGHPLTGWR